MCRMPEWVEAARIDSTHLIICSLTLEHYMLESFTLWESGRCILQKSCL